MDTVRNKRVQMYPIFILCWICIYICIRMCLSYHLQANNVSLRQRCPVKQHRAQLPRHARTSPTSFAIKGKDSLQKSKFRTNPETLLIHYQHFSLVTSLFGVPDFLNYVFLIYHNLKCFKSIANSDTTTGNVFQWNICADSYSFPSDTRGLCNLGITELLKLMAEGQAIFFVTLYIMLWFSKRVAGLFWFFTHS